MEALLLFTTIAAAAIFFILTFSKVYLRHTNKHLPPSPPKLPIIGNLHQIGTNIHASLDSLAQRYGPLMLLHFGKVPVLIVSSADAAREILKTHDITFASRPKLTPLDKIFYGCKDVAMAPYGEQWRQLKSISVLHLLSNKRINSFRNVRAEEISVMLHKIKPSVPMDLSEAFYTLTNDVVCRVALGRKHSSSSSDYGGEGVGKFWKLLGEVGELLGRFYVGDYIPWLGWVCKFNGLNSKLERTAKEIDEFLDGVVDEHEKKMNANGEEGGDGDGNGDQHKDFVDVLLWIQKENTLGFPVDRVSIKAIILNMFAAGTNTTFTGLESTMRELLKHPKIMKEVQNEIRGIVGDKSEVTEDDLSKMHYLKAVIKETLRIQPPFDLLLPRESTQDVKINGYDIPMGTQVYVNYGTISKDPASWEKPHEFLPERFLNSSVSFLGKDIQFIPFGAGRRICPGIEFAMRITEIALATLLNKFDWSLLPCGEGEEALEMPGSTAPKKSPLIALAAPV